MRIGICDDEIIFVNIIYDLVTDMLPVESTGYKVIKYTNPFDVLSDAETLDALFLDIDMPEMDGIILAKKIHERNRDICIILVTSHDDQYKEGFKIGAKRFVTKPIDKEEISDAIEYIMDHDVGFKVLNVYKNRKMCTLKQRDVLYLSSSYGHTIVHTSDELYRIEGSLSSIESILDTNIFFRVDKGCVLNMMHISNIIGRTVTLVSGERVYVAGSRIKKFNDRYRKFDIDING